MTWPPRQVVPAIAAAWFWVMPSAAPWRADRGCAADHGAGHLDRRDGFAAALLGVGRRQHAGRAQQADDAAQALRLGEARPGARSGGRRHGVSPVVVT